PLGNIETFVLGPKAIHAAEAYVLGLFQLYPTVYFHKATRGAEKIFAELLVRFVDLVRNNGVLATGLPKNHPLVRFARKPDNVEVALELDDTVVWGALTQMSEAKTSIIANLATRLRDRTLYKCIDIRAQVCPALDPKCRTDDEIIERAYRCCAEINRVLAETELSDQNGLPRLLIDIDERSPYNSIGQSKGPVDRINVRTDGGILVDLQERSSVVA